MNDEGVYKINVWMWVCVRVRVCDLKCNKQCLVEEGSGCNIRKNQRIDNK